MAFSAFRTVAARSAAKQAPLTARRSYVVGADLVGDAFTAERAHVQAHAAGSAELWRKITTYVAVPLVVVLGVHIWNVEQEHHHHKEHLKEENGGEMPERVVYSYMNMRRGAFPWGNQSLFFNPEANIKADD